jgi:hypothetical protein
MEEEVVEDSFQYAEWKKRSAWDEGLDVINSLLKPGSATADVMTDEQRKGLKKLKSMMLQGSVNRAENHIPRVLLAEESQNNDFLLAQFAGYKRPQGAGKKFKQIIAAHKVARKLKVMASAKFINQLSCEYGAHIPPAWFELERATQLRLRNLLSWENLSRWEFDIFEVDAVLKSKNTLVFVAWAIMASPNSQYAMEWACNQIPNAEDESAHDEGSHSEDNKNDKPSLIAHNPLIPVSERKGYDFLEIFGLKEEALIEFLGAIERRYLNTPYHNKLHAADVTQSLHVLLQMGGDNCTPKYEPVELFAILFSAVVHDVGHPGMNNLYQVHSQSDVAITYNDQSVLENLHAATAFQVFMGSNKDEKADVLACFSAEQRAFIRNFVIKTVLATDMTKHFTQKNLIRGLLHVAGAEDDPSVIASDAPSRQELLGFLLHLADISNPTKPFNIASKWTDVVLEEFFMQGDKEAEMGLPISPLCDRKTTSRPQSQIGFINFIVLPSYELLSNLIPRINTEILPTIRRNLAGWEELKRETEKKPTSSM